jgi:hypothetical protein
MEALKIRLGDDVQLFIFVRSFCFLFSCSGSSVCSAAHEGWCLWGLVVEFGSCSLYQIFRVVERGTKIS